MPEKKTEINLLPSKWKLPSRLRVAEKKLRLLSFGILTVYFIVIAGMFAWVGMLAMKTQSIQTQLSGVSSELNKYRAVEAAEELLNQKTSFAMKVAETQTDPVLAVVKALEFVPQSRITVQDINSDSRGKVSVGFIASSSSTLGEIMGNIESTSGVKNSILKIAISDINLQTNGNIQSKLDLGLVESAIKLQSLQHE